MTIMLAVINGILLGSVICILIHNLRLTQAVEARRGALNDELAEMLNKVSEVNNNIVGAVKRIESTEQENSAKIAMLMTSKMQGGHVPSQSQVLDMFKKRVPPAPPTPNKPT